MNGRKVSYQHGVFSCILVHVLVAVGDTAQMQRKLL